MLRQTLSHPTHVSAGDASTALFEVTCTRTSELVISAGRPVPFVPPRSRFGASPLRPPPKTPSGHRVCAATRSRRSRSSACRSPRFMSRRVSSAPTTGRVRICSTSRCQIDCVSSLVRCKRSFIVERANGKPRRAKCFSSRTAANGAHTLRPQECEQARAVTTLLDYLGCPSAVTT